MQACSRRDLTVDRGFGGLQSSHGLLNLGDKHRKLDDLISQPVGFMYAVRWLQKRNWVFVQRYRTSTWQCAAVMYIESQSVIKRVHRTSFIFEYFVLQDSMIGTMTSVIDVRDCCYGQICSSAKAMHLRHIS